MNWFYVDGGQQRGPVTDEQLDALFQSGNINEETLVWSEGMADWQPYGKVKPVEAPPPQPRQPDAPPPVEATWPSVQTPGAVCVECGKMFNRDEMIRHGNVYVCASCKPIFLQKLGEGVKIQTGELEYAGFWIRFAAKMLDGLIIGFVVFAPIFIFVFLFAFNVAAGSRADLNVQSGFTLGAASNGAEEIANLVGLGAQLFLQIIVQGVVIAYSTFFVGKYGATPGKMICKLKVVDSDGNKVGYGRAFGRSCAEILSQMVCDIGYIIAAFDGQKRTLHDHICNTRVVYK